MAAWLERSLYGHFVQHSLCLPSKGWVLGLFRAGGGKDDERVDWGCSLVAWLLLQYSCTAAGTGLFSTTHFYWLWEQP